MNLLQWSIRRLTYDRNVFSERISQKHPVHRTTASQRPSIVQRIWLDDGLNEITSVSLVQMDKAQHTRTPRTNIMLQPQSHSQPSPNDNRKASARRCTYKHRRNNIWNCNEHQTKVYGQRKLIITHCWWPRRCSQRINSQHRMSGTSKSTLVGWILLEWDEKLVAATVTAERARTTTELEWER